MNHIQKVMIGNIPKFLKEFNKKAIRPWSFAFTQAEDHPFKSDIQIGLIRESFISLVTIEGIKDRIVFSSISTRGKSSKKRAE